MTCTQVLNTTGLGLGMLGIVIIFCYGPPQPSFDEGVGIGLEDSNRLSDGRTVAQHNADQRELRGRYSLFSKIGLALVFMGFALQLLAVWV